MLNLFRKLLRGQGSRAAVRPRPASATAEILARKGRGANVGRPSSPPVEFDPYNTGAFDRSASWERISKRDL